MKVLREWRVCLCACVNYSASELSAAASKRNCLFLTVDHVNCRMLGRTSLPHGMVFRKDADPKMIGDQRSSAHGPARSPGRRKFSTSNKFDIINVPRRSHSAHPRQGNHTDARQTQARSKLSLEVPTFFPTRPCTDRQRRLRASPQWQSPVRSSKSQNSRPAARKVAVRPAMKPTVLGRPGSKLPPKNMNYSIKNQLRLKQSRENTLRQERLRKDNAAPDTLTRLRPRSWPSCTVLSQQLEARGQQTTSVAHSNRNSLKPRQYWSQRAIDSRRSASKTRCQRFKFWTLPGKRTSGLGHVPSYQCPAARSA